MQPMPGMAIVSVAAMAYRRIEGLAPYSEFGVTFPVYMCKIQKPWTAWVVRLSSARYHRGGAARRGQIYGYPKFVAEIDLRRPWRCVRCRVHAEERDRHLPGEHPANQTPGLGRLDLHPQGWAACEDIDPVPGIAWVQPGE